MMKSPREIEELADRAFNSLDNLQQAEANEYLYSKIKNRMLMSRQESAAKNTRLMYGLSAALLLFVCINITSFYLLSRPAQAQVKKADTGISAFSDAYFPKDNTYNY